MSSKATVSPFLSVLIDGKSLKELSAPIASAGGLTDRVVLDHLLSCPSSLSFDRNSSSMACSDDDGNNNRLSQQQQQQRRPPPQPIFSEFVFISQEPLRFHCRRTMFVNTTIRFHHFHSNSDLYVTIQLVGSLLEQGLFAVSRRIERPDPLSDLVIPVWNGADFDIDLELGRPLFIITLTRDMMR